MHTPFIGELLGTMMLIILGDGVVAGVLLQGSKAQNAGWVAITAGWAFAVLAGVFVATSTGSPDAHINPAVTIGFAVVSGDYSKIASYIPAQLIGAFLGGVIVWLQYLPHWAKTSDAGLKLAVFCTGPAIRNTGANLISEIIGTFVLVFVIAAIFSKSGLTWLPCWSGPSACRSAEPPVTPSIRPAILDRVLLTPCCRSPARAAPIGAIRGFRWSVLSLVLSLLRSSSRP